MNCRNKSEACELFWLLEADFAVAAIRVVFVKATVGGKKVIVWNEIADGLMAHFASGFGRDSLLSPYTGSE